VVNVGPVDEAWSRRRGLLDDAEAVERTVRIIRLRSRNPKAVITRAVCKMLADMAAKLRSEAGP
jgi:hypothetical protein